MFLMKIYSCKGNKRKFIGNQYIKRKNFVLVDVLVFEDKNMELSDDEEYVEGEKFESFNFLLVL